MRKTKTILVLAANPQNDLQLNEEIRELQGALRSLNKKLFQVEWELNAREKDFFDNIKKFSPQIIHFCGHATEKGLYLHDENDSKNQKLYRNEVLVDLLKNYKDRIECVFLNACNTEFLAQAISDNLNYAIGMQRPIQDQSAIAFSQRFYSALEGGENYNVAFELGKNALLGLDLAPDENIQKPQRKSIGDSHFKIPCIDNHEIHIQDLYIEPNYQIGSHEEYLQQPLNNYTEKFVEIAISLLYEQKILVLAGDYGCGKTFLSKMIQYNLTYQKKEDVIFIKCCDIANKSITNTYEDYSNFLNDATIRK